MAKSSKPKKAKVINLAQERMKSAQKNSPQARVASSKKFKPGAK